MGFNVFEAVGPILKAFGDVSFQKLWRCISFHETDKRKRLFSCFASVGRTTFWNSRETVKLAIAFDFGHAIVFTQNYVFMIPFHLQILCHRAPVQAKDEGVRLSAAHHRYLDHLCLHITATCHLSKGKSMNVFRYNLQDHITEKVIIFLVPNVC